MNLTDREKKILLQTARESISSKLTGKIPDYPEPTPTLLQKCGAFVTLHRDGKLRGCIGYVAAMKPLIETVKEVSQSSAFSDPRFPPVRMEELKLLEIEISVLSPLRSIESVEEIEVGEHGILIKQGLNSGLLLPQVAVEYNWDRKTFLSQTCRKAGLPDDCWRRSRPAGTGGETEIEIFSAVIFSEKDFAH